MRLPSASAKCLGTNDPHLSGLSTGAYLPSLTGINTAYSDRMAVTGLTDAAPRAEGRLARSDTPTAMAAATM
jgi:hypothetical protein